MFSYFDCLLHMYFPSRGLIMLPYLIGRRETPKFGRAVDALVYWSILGVLSTLCLTLRKYCVGTP
jgi:hypothetical protein